MRDGLTEETGGRDYRSESVQEYAETSSEGLKMSAMGGESAYLHRQTLRRDRAFLAIARLAFNVLVLHF